MDGITALASWTTTISFPIPVLRVEAVSVMVSVDVEKVSGGYSALGGMLVIMPKFRRNMGGENQPYDVTYLV